MYPLRLLELRMRRRFAASRVTSPKVGVVISGLFINLCKSRAKGKNTVIADVSVPFEWARRQRKGILLAVDLQNGFLITHECEAVVPKVVAHASQFHQVWATRFFNRNPNFSRQVNWNEMVSGQETELSSALIGVVSKTFDKPSYSPMSPAPLQLNIRSRFFFPHASTSVMMSPALLQALQRDAITTVAVCGVDTDACVMATALGLFDAGFETFVVSDACASSGGQEYHEAAIKILKRNIGEKYVISFSELPTMLSLGLAIK